MPMSGLTRFSQIQRYTLIGFIAPVIALGTIFIAILLSPLFTWEGNALSDLGHYTRTDLGSNQFIVAIIFNAGLILTSILMLYFVVSFSKGLNDIPTKIGMVILGIACVFLLLIGIFSENAGSIHFWVSAGFFFTFPFAMWTIAIGWFRFPNLRWFSLISFLLPFFSLYIWPAHFAGTLPWTGEAIPEIITAFSAIGWVWSIIILQIYGKISEIQKIE
jgi:hypothetical membrane protein